MKLVNTHTHTHYSGHGEGSVSEVVEAAAKAGISTVALTEHYPLSEAFDPDAYLSMPSSLLENYINDVLQARERFPELDILLGCEFDWLGSHEDRNNLERDLSRFDIVLGSVHYLDSWAFDDPNSYSKWEELGADYIWKRYFELWYDAVGSDMPFTIMSHPDLSKKFNIYPSYDLSVFYRNAAEAALESGRLVEVNTSGKYYACKEMYPAPALLSEFNRAGVPCTIGTDAHHPRNVARGLEEGIRLMYECGYREITLPRADGDRQTIVID